MSKFEDNGWQSRLDAQNADHAERSRTGFTEFFNNTDAQARQNQQSAMLVMTDVNNAFGAIDSGIDEWFTNFGDFIVINNTNEIVKVSVDSPALLLGSSEYYTIHPNQREKYTRCRGCTFTFSLRKISGYVKSTDIYFDERNVNQTVLVSALY